MPYVASTICQSPADLWWQALLHTGLLTAATTISTQAIAVDLFNHCAQLAQLSRAVLLSQDLSSTCLHVLGVLVVVQQQDRTLTYGRQTA